MTASNDTVLRSANLWLERHGDEAVARARGMVTEMRSKGDIDGADAWLRIIVAVEELRLGTVVWPSMG